MVAGISTLIFQGIDPYVLPSRQVIITICLCTFYNDETLEYSHNFNSEIYMLCRSLSHFPTNLE
jgi:hypothetical protein